MKTRIGLVIKHDKNGNMFMSGKKGQKTINVFMNAKRKGKKPYDFFVEIKD